jgi:uncharacterized membrane protein YjdF
MTDCSGRCQHPLKTYVFTFAAAIGFAAFIEPFEYLGYSQLGTGEGILFYGAGDGGWSDTAFDMFANMIGAALALALIYVKELFRKR